MADRLPKPYPRCEATVNRRTWHVRMFYSNLYPPELTDTRCKALAMFVVGGRKLCNSHAGNAALKFEVTS